jgi:hypothetical protein
VKAVLLLLGAMTIVASAQTYTHQRLGNFEFRAAPADELIAMGDTFYAKLQATEALKYYLPAEKLEPNNVRLLEHISREYRHLMIDATSAQEKLSLGNTAVNYARRAAAI